MRHQRVYRRIVLILTLFVVACQPQAEATNTPTDKPVKQTANTTDTTNTMPTLEVIGVFPTDNGYQMRLITPDRQTRYEATVNNHPALPVIGIGDYVKIAGQYAQSNPIKIHDVRQITWLVNPEKTRCEAVKGSVWKPQGKAQIPACIRLYSDAGKTCTTSTQCQGDCIVTRPNQPATCASSSSSFGCGATIEHFKQNGRIICRD